MYCWKITIKTIKWSNITWIEDTTKTNSQTFYKISKAIKSRPNMVPQYNTKNTDINKWLSKYWNILQTSRETTTIFKEHDQSIVRCSYGVTVMVGFSTVGTAASVRLSFCVEQNDVNVLTRLLSPQYNCSGFSHWWIISSSSRGKLQIVIASYRML